MPVLISEQSCESTSQAFFMVIWRETLKSHLHHSMSSCKKILAFDHHAKEALAFDQPCAHFKQLKVCSAADKATIRVASVDAVALQALRCDMSQAYRSPLPVFHGCCTSCPFVSDVWPLALSFAAFS